MLIDSHAHLYLPEFEEDIDNIISNAKQAGVEKIYLPNIDISTVDSLKKLSDNYPDCCIPMMGLHPCYVKDDYETQLDELQKELKTYPDYYKAVGEIGIDLHWDTSTKDIQIEAFEKQIEWSLDLNLPIVIHSRDSQDLTIEVVTKYKDSGVKGIFHCFGGTLDQAQKIMDLGFLMGIGGVVTFKNSGLDKVVKEIPLEYLVLETDSPYLAPTPHRGSRNVPENILVIAQKLADVKDIDIKTIAELTSNNVLNLF